MLCTLNFVIIIDKYLIVKQKLSNYVKNNTNVFRLKQKFFTLKILVFF